MRVCRRQSEQVRSSTAVDVPLDTHWIERLTKGALG
jgi:hypothetical protein